MKTNYKKNTVLIFVTKIMKDSVKKVVYKYNLKILRSKLKRTFIQIDNPSNIFLPYSGVSTSRSSCLRKKALVLFFIVAYEYDLVFKFFGKVFLKTDGFLKKAISHESTLTAPSIYKYICSFKKSELGG